MKTLKELQERMSAALKEGLELGAIPADALTDEQDQRIKVLVLEINDLGPQIDAAAQRATDLERMQALNTAYNASAGTRASGRLPQGEQNGNVPPIDRRSIGRRFAQSDEYKAAASHPKGVSAPVPIPSFYPEHQRSIVYDGQSPEELRTLIATGAFPADLIQPQFVPGIFRGIEPPLNIRDVLINGQTNSDAIVYFRELLFTNAAVEVAQATTTSDGAKPESALTFEQATAPVVTIAHWVPITRQTLQDAAQMEAYINQRLITGLKRREDAQLLNGNGSGANMTGILATSGIQLADAAYFTGAPVQDAGTANENPNRIRRAKRLVRVTGQAMPTFVVLHPADVEQFETYTDGERQYLLGGPYAPALRPMWGLRIVESENIAENTALVGDGTAAAVWDRMQAALYTTDSHSDFFIRNILVILAEERLALTVFRPAAFVKVTLVA